MRPTGVMRLTTGCGGAHIQGGRVEEARGRWINKVSPPPPAFVPPAPAREGGDGAGEGIEREEEEASRSRQYDSGVMKSRRCDTRYGTGSSARP